jgi:hypothetical protein
MLNCIRYRRIGVSFAGFFVACLSALLFMTNLLRLRICRHLAAPTAAYGRFQSTMRCCIASFVFVGVGPTEHGVAVDDEDSWDRDRVMVAAGPGVDVHPHLAEVAERRVRRSQAFDSGAGASSLATAVEVFDDLIEAGVLLIW